jgi:hypothetical protein
MGRRGVKGKVSMLSKLTSIVETVRSDSGALNGGRVSKFGECLMTGVDEPLMPKRRRGGCKEGRGRRK